MAAHRKAIKPVANRLLSALAEAEYDGLRSSLVTVRLHLGDILYRSGESIRDAYFPESGTVSFISVAEDGSSIEVAIVGNEGMVGLPVSFGIKATLYQTIVQAQGSALRIGAEALRDEFKRRGTLHDLLLRHNYALLAQISQTALCNHFHTAEQRLSRWLLMTADRVGSDRFKLTQQFLSHILVSGRQRVNVATGFLRKKGLIHYARVPGMERRAA